MTHNENKNSTLELKVNGHISAYYRRPNFAILGSCIPQDQKLVDEGNRNVGTGYPQNTKQVESGQRTVDIIRSALDSLPGLKTRQTPPNSKADVVWKWDLILEYQEYLYPIQVKSGIDDIEICQEYLSIEEERLSEGITNIQDSYENRIKQIMDKHGWERENKHSYALQKECNEKILPWKEGLENYKNRLPLFVWAAEDEDTVVDLVRVFAQLFSIQGDLKTFETIAVQAYRDTKPETPIQKALREECLERKQLSEIYSLLADSLADRTCSLGGSKRLEDIFSTQIVKNARSWAENKLKQLNVSIEKLERGIETSYSPLARLSEDRGWKTLCEKLEKSSKFDNKYNSPFSCYSSNILQLAKKYTDSLRKSSLSDGHIAAINAAINNL